MVKQRVKLAKAAKENQSEDVTKMDQDTKHGNPNDTQRNNEHHKKPWWKNSLLVPILSFYSQIR